MGSVLISVNLLLLLFSFIDSLPANFLPLMPGPLKGIDCKSVNCGRGSCKASNETFLGFECECFPGWKKIHVGPLIFPFCVVPNCTIDFECGSSFPPLAPPPLPPLLPPQLDFLNPCALSWCGDGRCVNTGTNHICKCNKGSANLLNETAFACFKECHLGADCKGLGLGLYGPPSPPPLGTSESRGNSMSLKEAFLLVNFVLYIIID